MLTFNNVEINMRRVIIFQLADLTIIVHFYLNNFTVK